MSRRVACYPAMTKPTRTYHAKSGEVPQDWYIVDARNRVLGRLATAIAHRLRGKHKPEYTRHVDTGDHIIVINARHVHVTGNKRVAKRYYHHSGYPGGLKTLSFEQLLERRPEEVIRRAVRGMLPRTPLGRQMLRKLRIYPGIEHPHVAQQPAALAL